MCAKTHRYLYIVSGEVSITFNNSPIYRYIVSGEVGIILNNSPIHRYIVSGQVGITLNCDWFEPEDPVKQSDMDAAERGLQFFLGWYAHPIFVDGDYPQVMKTYIQAASLAEGRPRSRLPEFTQQEMMRINGQIRS